MLERSASPADWIKYHVQEIQVIHPRGSDKSSDQSAQPGHLPHRNTSQKTAIYSLNISFL
jgi:hypothetical protein